MAFLAYQVYCPASGQTVLAGCACEDAGHDVAATGVHHDRCQMNNLTANLACAGAAQCCGDVPADHDCEAVSNACPREHDGACDASIEACAVHHPVVIIAGQGAAVLRPVAVT